MTIHSSSVLNYLDNAERFILYFLCGCLMGIVLILLTIILVLYMELRSKTDLDDQSSQAETDEDDTRCYLPVYRYSDRVQHDFYQA